MSENQTDHARGCQGREYTCTCGYDDQREWKPIETAPAVGKKRLMFWTKNGRVVVGHRFSGTSLVISQDHVSYTATHWQPLPSPPKPLPTPSIQVAE